MTHTVNTSHVRALNQRAILSAIYEREGISKAELARNLRMSKPSMADNVNNLLEIGIIQEIGQGAGETGRGRKPTLLSFRDDFKYIIALDFHYQYSVFLLSNLRGTVINEFTIQQTPLQNFKAWLELCRSAISMLLASQSLSCSDLAAVAVSAPGILNVREERYIISSRYGDFNLAELKKSLSEAFPVPILIKNSTNAAALGELYYGQGQDCKNLVYISCGQGVGAGIILDGRLHEGFNAAAGEIGSCVTPQSLSAPKVSLEERICIDSILDRINQSGRFPGESVTFSRMLSLWEAEDPYIRDIAEEISTELGCAICNLIAALDLERIVLGGDYLALEAQMLPVISSLVSRHCLVPAPVTASRLGEKATTYGLIATSREFFFEQICAR